MLGYKLLLEFKRGHCLKFAVFAIEHVGAGNYTFVLFMRNVFGILGQGM
jgi:hypothetical protein